jgi:serine/threonine protein kinase
MLIGKYRLSRVIGDGSFFTVKLGVHSFTNQPAAVKIVSKASLSSMQRDEFVGRVERLRTLRSGCSNRLFSPSIICIPRTSSTAISSRRICC